MYRKNVTKIFQLNNERAKHLIVAGFLKKFQLIFENFISLFSPQQEEEKNNLSKRSDLTSSTEETSENFYSLSLFQFTMPGCQQGIQIYFQTCVNSKNLSLQ